MVFFLNLTSYGWLIAVRFKVINALSFYIAFDVNESQSVSDWITTQKYVQFNQSTTFGSNGIATSSSNVISVLGNANQEYYYVFGRANSGSANTRF